MRRDNSLIKKIVDDIIAALDPSDPRRVEFQLTETDEGVSQLAVSILEDLSVAQPIAHRALLLLPMLPTQRFIAQSLRTMRDRPELARVSGRGLRKVKDPSIIQELGSMLLDLTLAPESRAEAAAVLGTLGDPRGKPFLVRALKDQEPTIMRNAAYGIGYIQLLEGSTNAAEDLCGLLNSRFPEVRLAALNALSNMLATQALDRVEALLDDPGMTESGERIGARAAEVSRLLRGAGKGT